jgi:hypothetical protein
MARPLPRTHIAQSDYAMLMGINPINFEGCSVDGLFQEVSGCNSVWPRFAWQTAGNASREDLAIQLDDAERTIGRYSLGFNVAPEWVELDMPYPGIRSGQSVMRDIYNKYRTISLQQGKVIAGGRRAVYSLGTFLVTYTDDDGDGFPERATIDLANEYDWREIRIYHKGTDANPEWEIKPINRIDKTTYEIHMDSWLFVDPDLTSAFPRDRTPVVDISAGTNLVAEVDVYLEYNDVNSPSCQFIWNSDGSTQDGYLDIVDHEAGVVRPIPATFEYGVSCTVTPVSLCGGNGLGGSEPDRVKLWFYAGNISQDYLAGYTYDPLAKDIAESIRLLATARLDRDLCGCSNIIALGKDLRKDMSLVSPQGNFLAVADVIQECPFGTRRGEWLAWNRMKTYTDKYVSVAVI